MNGLSLFLLHDTVHDVRRVVQDVVLPALVPDIASVERDNKRKSGGGAWSALSTVLGWGGCCAARPGKKRAVVTVSPIACEDEEEEERAADPRPDPRRRPSPLLSFRVVSSEALDERTVQLLWQVLGGAQASLPDRALDDGLGGVYEMPDVHGRPVAIFKPAVEEPGMPGNPTGRAHPDDAVRPSIVPGESVYREVAAFLLDADGFVGVPPTCLVEYSLDGTFARGSLQSYVESKCVAGDMGFSMFSDEDVQRIAMFDLRVLNLDRHDGNILVALDDQGKARLTPIDHGLCLPSRVEASDFEWCWLHWPQVKRPILPSVAARIEALNADQDIAVLARACIPLDPGARRVLRLMAVVLQKGARAGLSLFDIAQFSCRSFANKRSRLETSVARCRWKAAVRCVRVPEQHRVDFDTALLVAFAGSVVFPVDHDP